MVRTGLLYFIKVSSFLSSDKIIGEKIAYVEIDKDRSIDIDDIEDWDKCEEFKKELNFNLRRGMTGSVAPEEEINVSCREVLSKFVST